MTKTKKSTALLLVVAMILGLFATVFTTTYAASNTLTLQYDDRYDISDYKSGYVVVSISNEKATSYDIENGKVTSTKDDSVLSLEDDGTLIADGVGTATIVIAPEGKETVSSKQVTVSVTVEPATLTLMLVGGQSNATGATATNTGYELNETVACEPGTVYSTYVAETTGYASRNGLTAVFTSGDASEYVAGDLTSNLSYTGEELEYDIDTLTSDGTGKLGLDSALAYEWNQLTGDKVYIVNGSWTGTAVKYWIKGGKAYTRAWAIYKLAVQTYEAEIASGHYIEGNRLAFWMQGETDASNTAEDYETKFAAVCKNYINDFDIENIGVLSVRAASGNYGLEDVEMTGSRTALYTMCNSDEYPYLFMVSNVGEQWVTDDGVEEYFEEAYPEGYITCPTQDASKYASSLPTTIAEVHNDIHYSQTGHNENGITAAQGMYAVVYGEDADAVEWRDASGLTVTEMIVVKNVATPLICTTTQPSLSKQITFGVSSSSRLSYDSEAGTITGKTTGTSYVYAYINGVKVSKIKITVKTQSVINTTGLVYDESVSSWVYWKNGSIDTSYTGVASNDYGIFYVSNGYVDWTYCGPYKENGTTYYFYNGYASDTGLLLGTDGDLYYYVDGVLTKTYTGLAVSSYGTYYVVKGVVDYSKTGVYSMNGAYRYVSASEVKLTTGLKQINSKWYLAD